MKQTFTKIKVVGIGGGGSNAISRMKKSTIEGVELIAINCDVQDLQKTKAHIKLRIGTHLTKGLGAGMNPEIGKKSAQESKNEIMEVLRDADMVFITAGLGGGTGSGAGPVVAEIAKSLKALVIGVVTTPFSFEGEWRKEIAKKALDELENKVDTLLVIPNDRILSQVEKETTVKEAFLKCDEVLRQAVESISDLITLPGIVNVDFADIKSIMKDGGRAFFGQGISKGEKRIEKAMEGAINSPLLDFSIKGAKGVLFNVAGGEDLTLKEIETAAEVITEKIHPKAKVIFGAVIDKTLKKGEVKVTVIATGVERV